MLSVKNTTALVCCKEPLQGISKQMLVNQLRELEKDKIIERIIYAEMPPRVEYKITKYGHSLMPVIAIMQDWGLKDLRKNSK